MNEKTIFEIPIYSMSKDKLRVDGKSKRKHYIKILLNMVILLKVPGVV